MRALRKTICPLVYLLLFAAAGCAGQFGENGFTAKASTQCDFEAKPCDEFVQCLSKKIDARHHKNAAPAQAKQRELSTHNDDKQLLMAFKKEAIEVASDYKKERISDEACNIKLKEIYAGYTEKERLRNQNAANAIGIVAIGVGAAALANSDYGGGYGNYYTPHSNRSGYQGNCPCPYDLDSAGNVCGKRSAYSRSGGYSPSCY